MAKSSTFSNNLLQLIFQNLPIATLAQSNSSANLTNLYVSLHTADPGVTGNQTTSEVGYTGYARATVARSTAGWTVTATQCFPVANIQFASGTGGTGVVTNWSVGVAASGASEILWTGTVSPSINTGVGVTPILTTASFVQES